MNALYRILLTFNATSWMLVIYVIKIKWSVFNTPVWMFGIMLQMFLVSLSWLALYLTRKMGDDSLTKCQESTPADNEFLPTYLGYFFVSLSVPDHTTMLFLYSVVFVFTFLSQAQYFNPLYLLFGYHCYDVLTVQGTRVFVIVKGNIIRNNKDMSFDRLKRINDTTYLALKEEKVTL